MHALLTSLVAFGFGFIGSVPLTGPVAILVVARSVQRQFGAAVRIGLGAAVAEALYAGIAFWGFATFLTRHPLILPLSHGVSAAVLTAVGLYFLRWGPGPDGEPERPRRLSGFLLGFTVSALNPTLLATWSAATAVLYSRQLVTFSGLLAVPFGLAAGAGVACWELVLIGLLERFRDRFPRRALTWGVRGMGVLLLGVAVLAALDLVRALSGATP
jgi:threonine/homoserine/homoserine lactone efflux protein